MCKMPIKVYCGVKHEHMDSVLAGLRFGDRQELDALDLDLSPEEALRESILHSAKCFTLLSMEEREEAIAISGVSDRGSGIGSPWLVGTDKVGNDVPAFHDALSILVHAFFSRFHRLENMIDARQLGHIRCLKKLGFTVEEAKPFRNGLFHRFYMERA